MYSALCTFESAWRSRGEDGGRGSGREPSRSLRPGDGPGRGVESESMRRQRLPEKLYRIGEVIDHTGLSRQTLHFYATIGLIAEKRRTPAGYRLFPPTVFAALERVRRLQKRGYTLREIREILEGKSKQAHATRPRAAKTTRTDQTEKENPRSGRISRTPPEGREPHAAGPPRHAPRWRLAP